MYMVVICILISMLECFRSCSVIPGQEQHTSSCTSLLLSSADYDQIFSTSYPCISKMECRSRCSTFDVSFYAEPDNKCSCQHKYFHGYTEGSGALSVSKCTKGICCSYLISAVYSTMD